MKALEEEWRQILEETVARDEAAGVSLLCVQNGREVCHLTSGWADRERRLPVKEDTIFRLYSMTKPVTAVAAMMLAERGALEPDAPLAEYLPDFAGAQVWNGAALEKPRRPVLVRDLLFMTSGLSYGDSDTATETQTRALLAKAEQSLETERPVTTAEFAREAAEIPLLFQPGTSWKYGISADILGAAIERAAGMRFGEFLRREIFEPLGMEDTGFFVPAKKQGRLARAYERTAAGNAPYTGSFLGVRNAMDREAAFESGGAGLVSTARDYARFAQLLLGEGSAYGVRLLQPETVRLMRAGRLGEAPQAAFESWFGDGGYRYGYLMRTLEEPARSGRAGLREEYGWDGWLGCVFWNCPRENMTLLIMQQQLGGGDLVQRVKEALVRCQGEIGRREA